MAFSSSTLVKTHLKISGTTYDSLLTQLCAQVDAYITQETGVPTGAAVVTYTNEIVDSEGCLMIKAKHHPIATITKIESKQSDNTWLEYTDETAANIDFDNERIYPLYLVAGKGKRNIRLTYTAGYATASVPADLQLAAIIMVAQLFNTRNALGFGSQNTLGLVQTVLTKNDFIGTTGEHIYIKKILTKYKPVYAI